MREILFRGKSKHGWAYGIPLRTSRGCKDSERAWIIEHAVQSGGWVAIQSKQMVEPETVSQYTGLKDSNGKKIFEGDILLYPEYEGSDSVIPEHVEIVYWGDFGWETKKINGEWCGCLEQDNAQDCAVVGNIWDNPEMMEEDHERERHD